MPTACNAANRCRAAIASEQDVDLRRLDQRSLSQTLMVQESAIVIHALYGKRGLFNTRECCSTHGSQPQRDVPRANEAETARLIWQVSSWGEECVRGRGR